MPTANLEVKTVGSDTQKQEWQRERDQLLKTIASLKNKLEDSQAQLSAAASKPADNSVESRLKAVATGKQWYKGFTAPENQSAAANVFKGWFNKTSEPVGVDSSNKALPPIDSVMEPSHINQIEQLKVQLKNTEQELNETTSMLENYRQETEKLESKLNFSRDEIEQQALLLKNGEESKLLFQGELRKLMVENQKLAKELEQIKAEIAKPIEKALDSPDKVQTENKGTKGTESKRQSVPIEKEVVTNLRNELAEAKQENVRLETTIEEIKCNYQFIVDSLTERDEKIKKQKATIESLKSKIETLEQQSQKFDKEKEALNSSISTLSATISTKDQEIEVLHDDLKKSKSRLDELITESQSLRDQVEIMKDKYEMSEQEHSISGKKATQLLKDLQKELKRKGPSVPEMSEYPNSILTTSFKPPVKEPSQGGTLILSRSKSASSSVTTAD